MKQLIITFVLFITLPLYAGQCCKYIAEILSVYDGDTVTAEFIVQAEAMILGVKTKIEQTKTEQVRLYGLDAPELRGDERKEGIRSRDALRKMIDGHVVVIETDNDKRGKYGRLIGTIFKEDNGKMINVNDWLIRNGYAREAYYD